MKFRKGIISIISAGSMSTGLLMFPAATSATQIIHAPRISEKVPQTTSASGFGWSSSNWSGYAITGGPYNSMTGTWVVPTVSATSKSSYSSSWIGIDGYNNSNLIQTGTEQDYYSGKAHYGAWWEILPASETVITNMTIHPGDTMNASIQNLGNGQWSITLTDKTTGQSFTTNQAYSGPQTSAEWIQEAPTIGGRVATMAHYGQITFDPGTVNGTNPNLVTSDGGTMVQSRTQVSTPSVPDKDTDGFNAAYGSTQPPAPAS